MNKTVLITGGAKGIGRAIVKELAQKGYNIVFTYNNSKEEADILKKELNTCGYSVENYEIDLSRCENIQGIVEFTLNKFKKIDILINNAAIAQTKLFTEITQEDWNNMMNVNLNSVFYLTQQVVKNMIYNQYGCIINISSIWGLVGASCEVHYSVTKAGIDALTKSLAKELGPSNIRVNSVAPGIIDTNMNSNLNEGELLEIKNSIPLGRIGKPEDIVKCIIWLIEDEYTTGQIISPNGGWVIK